MFDHPYFKIKIIANDVPDRAHHWLFTYMQLDCEIEKESVEVIIKMFSFTTPANMWIGLRPTKETMTVSCTKVSRFTVKFLTTFSINYSANNLIVIFGNKHKSSLTSLH